MADWISAGGSVLPPVYDIFATHAGYISKFDDNLADLQNALKDLQAKIDDVLSRIQAEELRLGKRSAEVDRWLEKLNTNNTNINLLVTEASGVQQRLATYGYCCSTIIYSVYGCGKKISKMLDEVYVFIGPLSTQAVRVPTRPPVVLAVTDQQTFGLDAKLQSTWDRLMDVNIRRLGIYGMAGVGKTTLLSLIETKFDEVKDDYDFVIWVEVSKDQDTGKIQDDIGKRLGINDEKWSTKSSREKCYDITNALKKKPRFVLLLDNLWKKVDLRTIGIHLRGSQYKVVFTTRSKNLCRVMEANEDIEVERLAEVDALNLLKKNAGRDVLDGDMLKHAKYIVEKCLGLPLALEVIGRCLSSRTSADEWRDVFSTLESLDCMDNDIFPVLKCSYDNLREEAKLCLQYCALFPKAYRMRKDELVEYWIGERILHVEKGREEARVRGYDIIQTLVWAWFLLEDGESNQKVYMHGLIQEMALWIVLRCGNKFIVQTGAKLVSLPLIEDWTTVKKMSLMYNDIQSITETSSFPRQKSHVLQTLFLQKNKLEDIVDRFFLALSTLVVLDLSSNLGITELPAALSVLKLLRYLNLFETRIKSLEAIKSLFELIHLDLESTSNLRSISPISGLTKLQVLRFYSSASLDVSLLKSLKRMEHLKVLTITIEKDFEVLKAFLENDLERDTQGLKLDGLQVSVESFAATFGVLGNLSKLGMTECNIIESGHTHAPSTSSNQITPSPSNTWFKNLSAVELLCVHVKDLTWLSYAANLESLSVISSPEIEEVVSQEKVVCVNMSTFSKLQVLRVEYLDKLKSIYWVPLSFPKLHELYITECPNLHKLPLSEERIDALRIKQDVNWWLRGVKWERGAEEGLHHAVV